MTQTHASPRSDTDIRAAVAAELLWIPGLDATGIGIAVEHGAVTLSGKVDSYAERLHAEKAALRLRGVTAVADEITVRTPGAPADDSDIAREVGEALERAVEVPRTVTAVVRDRVVILEGEVTWQFQRLAAERAVRYLRGITDVRNKIVLKPTVEADNVHKLINSALVRNAQLDSNRISVTSTPLGVVTLRGAVQSYAERQQAEHAAWAAPGVTRVVNELVIGI
jgi:osmotically-inducible protein OsmY